VKCFFVVSTYLGLSEQPSTSHINLLHFGLAFNRRSQHILYKSRSERKRFSGHERGKFGVLCVYRVYRDGEEMATFGFIYRDTSRVREEKREKKLEFNWIKLVNSSKCNTIKSKIACVHFLHRFSLVFFVFYHPGMHYSSLVFVLWCIKQFSHSSHKFTVNIPSSFIHHHSFGLFKEISAS
jgi:hypothetical protein